MRRIKRNILLIGYAVWHPLAIVFGLILPKELAFRYYYDLSQNAQLAQKDPVTIQRHLQYLDELAKSLGIKMET